MNDETGPPSNEPLPVVAPPALEEPREEQDIWGVLLAAGTSSRFGSRNKLLEDVDGEPMVRRVAETLLATRLTSVVIVVGHDAVRVRSCLSDLNVHATENDAYEQGQSTSVREGVKYIAENGADAILIALGDMPYLSPQTVDAIIAAYEDGAGSALAAAYKGKRGNPVLFDARHFDALTSVKGDTGGRHILLESGDGVLVETGDPGVHRDIDKPDDWYGANVDNEL